MWNETEKIYTGVKLSTSNLVFKRELPDGISHELKPYESAKLLPDAKGFYWGFQENCQQLALALLLDICHKPEVSLVYSNVFANDYVKWFPEEWKLESEFIESWLEEKVLRKQNRTALEMVYEN